jgi:hypothetical protein
VIAYLSIVFNWLPWEDPLLKRKGRVKGMLTKDAILNQWRIRQPWVSCRDLLLVEQV